MVLLVLELDVAATGSAVDHVNHVFAVNKLGKLSVRCGTGPGSIMDVSLDDNLVLIGRVSG